MITKNFKNLMAMMLHRSGGSEELLPIKATSGEVHYITPSSFTESFPYTYTGTYSETSNAAGIELGGSQISPTEDDYAISRCNNLSCNVSVSASIDSFGNPVSDYTLIITNADDNNSITIAEIGFIQDVKCSDGNVYSVLLDRTVLDTPIELQVGETTAIKYTLKTILPS